MKLQTYGEADFVKKVHRMLQGREGWIPLGVPLNKDNHEEEQ